jgi:hypothetical protein
MAFVAFDETSGDFLGVVRVALAILLSFVLASP